MPSESNMMVDGAEILMHVVISLTDTYVCLTKIDICANRHVVHRTCYTYPDCLRRQVQEANIVRQSGSGLDAQSINQ